MAGKSVEGISSSVRVKASKQIEDALEILKAGDDCGCVTDQGCCQNKGCCKEGHCPAEMPAPSCPGDISALLGCAGDNFSINIKDHQELLKDYIIKNKKSVIKYFKEKGVNLEQ
jgi:hypothetical protein